MYIRSLLLLPLPFLQISIVLNPLLFHIDQLPQTGPTLMITLVVAVIEVGVLERWFYFFVQEGIFVGGSGRGGEERWAGWGWALFGGGEDVVLQAEV